MSGDYNSKARDIILSNLGTDGKTIGNVTFKGIFEKEGLTGEQYNQTREELLNEGLIAARRGRGGAITRVAITELDKNDTKETDDTSIVDVKPMILRIVPKDGSSIGNTTLIRTLKKAGISPDSYWMARNELIQSGELVKGRGMGGSVSIPDKPKTLQTLDGAKRKYKKEKDLYGPFEKTLREYWIKENHITARRCVVETTANQGRRQTGGKWTRPDVTIVAVNTFRFVPGKILDVITFEIKPANDLDIIGVFETASHSRFAVKSYLAIHLPDGKSDLTGSQIDFLTKECERFGIGFMYFKNPADPGTRETILEPARKTPDPAEIDNFLSVQISKKNQDEIHRML